MSWKNRSNQTVRVQSWMPALMLAMLLTSLCSPPLKAQNASSHSPAIKTSEIPERSAGSYLDEVKVRQNIKTVIPRAAITSTGPEDPDPNAPPLNNTIEGINFEENAALNGSYFIPPDPIGAAGPSHVLSVTNCSIEWFTKAGVTEKSEALSSFFSSLTPLTATFDPKVIYDQYAGRFVVISLERTDVASGAASNTSRILVAVSDDGDPNGAWRFHAINSKIAIGGVDHWADYPGLAVDEEAIYITNNMFTFSPTSFGGARLWIIHKTPFYAGGAATVTVHDPSTVTGVSATTMQPAHMFGSGPAGVGTFLVRYSGYSDGVSEFLSIIRVDAPTTAPSFSHQFVSLGNVDHTAVGTLPDAPQLGSAFLVDTGDRRALHAVWRNNALWATTHVYPGTGLNALQVTAHWAKVNTTTLAALALADQGDIGGEEIAPGAYTFYPAIAVDASDNAGLGFALSGPSVFPGAYYTARLAANLPGVVQPITALRAGQDYYYRAFGGARNRWGDYSGMSIDPSDDLTFWIFNEYALTRGTVLGGYPLEDGRWGTAFGSFKFGVITAPTLEWAARFNSAADSTEEALAIVTDDGDNSYVAGYSLNTAGNADFLVIKYNAAGVKQWAARYNGPGAGEDKAYAVGVDTDGNVYVAGASTGAGGNLDAVTIQYNSAGTRQWVARHNGNANAHDGLNDLACDASGNVYVAGYVTTTAGGIDFLALKYNSAGVRQWQAVEKGPGVGEDRANELALEASGNVHVAGYSSNASGNFDFITVKYKNDGVKIWKKTFNGGANGHDAGNDVALDPNGNVFVAGYSNNAAGNEDYLLLKYDANGVLQWNARYNGPGSGTDVAHDVAADESGNAYVTGASAGAAGNRDYATHKYNPGGVKQWTARYNGPGGSDDEARRVLVDGSGNVFVTGNSFGLGTNHDYVTVNYNNAGVQQWLRRQNGAASGAYLAVDMALEVSGNLYVTGTSRNAAGNEDFYTVKYSPVIPGAALSFAASEQQIAGESATALTPATFSLEQNYPNPFNPATNIRFHLAQAGQVKLAIYNVRGELVQTLTHHELAAGEHVIPFDGRGLASGLYFYRLATKGFTATRKMILEK